ncbi:MAG: CHAT domain-containing protein [Bacteroidales bacterium]|nr:CHAT domain-containing protein [Bacteroidales bacterium]
MLVKLRLLILLVVICLTCFGATALPYNTIDTIATYTADKHLALRYSSQTQPDSAIFYFQKALERSPAIDSTAAVLLYLAEEYRIQRENEKALKYIMQLELIIDEGEYTDKQLFYQFLHLKGKLYSDTGRYREAIALFDSAIRFIEETIGRDAPSLIKIVNYKGVTAYFMGNQELAMQAYKKALRIALKNEMKNIDLADIYQNIGIGYIYKGSFDSALLYLNQSKNLYEALFPEDDPVLSGFYINYGRILSMAGDVGSAYDYYLKAEKIMDVHNLENDILNGHLQVNIGSYLHLKNDYEKALIYFLNAQDIYRKNYESNHPFNITVSNNLATIYNQLGDFDKAQQIAGEALEQVTSPITKTQLIRNIARAQAGKLQQELAIKSYLKAIEISNKELGAKHFETANSHVILADYYWELTNYQEAYKNYVIAYQIFEMIFGHGDTELADVLLKQAICELHLTNYEHALALIKDAESNLLYYVSDSSGQSTTTNSFTNIRLADVYYWWGKLYHRWYEQQADPQKLKNSLNYFHKATKLLDQVGLYITDESRILLNQDIRDKLNEAFVVAAKLNTISGENSYIQDAFYFSEKSRAAVLLSSIRKSEAMQLSGINDSIAKRESNLREDLSLIQKLKYEEQQKSFPNEFRLAFLEKKQLEIMREIEQLTNYIQQNYPDYNALAFSAEVVSLSDIQQKIQPDETLIAYILAKKQAYAIVADHTSSHIIPLSDTDSVLDMTDQLLSQLKTDFGQHGRVDFNRFSHSSNGLYKALVADLIPFIGHKRLIIIPDGRLGYLPFELLISEAQNDTTKIDYRSLNYLVKKYAISYQYSATIGFGSQSKKSQANGKVLAVVPDYSNFSAVDLVGRKHIQLNELPFAKEESDAVLSHYNGYLALGAEATKQAFLEDASNYSILHLAMHTIIDDENPMYSRLIFQQQSDSIDFYALGTYELFGLRLNASMAVLSACNTGYGKLRQGEGIMSLTRGFVHAGVPSIVMTNWEVNDQASAQLMESFYKYLSEGMDKDLALQKAKTDFLAQANQLKAHPYFWASYVIIGNTEPIDFPIFSERLIVLLLSGFLIVILMFGFMAYNRRRKSSKRL